LKELEARFAEVEKRLRILIGDNGRLKKRVAELEKELAQARVTSEEFQNFQGKRLHVREKIEKVLRSLEAIKEKAN
jgi:hypothetical protein